MGWVYRLYVVGLRRVSCLRMLLHRREVRGRIWLHVLHLHCRRRLAGGRHGFHLMTIVSLLLPYWIARPYRIRTYCRFAYRFVKLWWFEMILIESCKEGGEDGVKETGGE